ncbi:MAG: hypothetical protein KBT03_02895 [Bacteroidales bacterium]|nr:hypothetical protein [Candidatus Scybalousia scybalohippi]
MQNNANKPYEKTILAPDGNLISYATYLQTKYWRNFRKNMLINNNFQCKFCKKYFKDNPTTLHIHHKKYRHFFDEKEKDCVVLCADCHSKLHEGIKNKIRTWGGGYKKNGKR